MDINRAFIALPFASHGAALLRARDCSEGFAQHLRWVAPTNLHLTLAFLDGLPATEVPNVCSVISACCTKKVRERIAREFTICQQGLLDDALFFSGRKD